MSPLSLDPKHLIRLATVLLCGLMSALAAPVAAANCDANVALKGINLAGAEFNGSKLPGALYKDYVYPNRAEFDYFASISANTVRLPILWERIQPSLSGALDAAELLNLKTVLAMAKARNMCIILDVHNYGTFRGQAIGSPEVPVQAFIDLWTRLAAEFGDPSLVAFGLMNEPAKLPTAQWANAAQETVNAIRKAGAANLILVSGGRWSGVHDWEKPIGGTSNALAFAHFTDPMQRSLIEVHQYADQDYSGTHQTCVPAANFAKIFDDITRWAKTNHQQLFLGEFGTPPNQACLDALDAILAQMNDTSIWRGWTYWAAGAWWGKYPLSIEPRKGEDTPQITILKKYL